jgi:plastocyanin
MTKIYLRFPFLSTCFLFLSAPLTVFAQAPFITTFAPLANAQAARTSPITITFSQPLAETSAEALKVFSQQRGGLRTQASTPAVVNSHTLSFTPAPYAFLPGELVQYTVTKAAHNSSGALATPQVRQFNAAVGGNGRGHFTTGSFTAIGGNESRIAEGDIDSDGDIDLVVAKSFSTPLIYLNNGKGEYSQTTGVNLPSQVQADDVALGDVDGDGDLDLVAADEGVFTDSFIPVCLNDGAGTFTFSHFIQVAPGSHRVILGDIDADGDLDLLSSAVESSSPTSRTIAIRLNDGTGIFTGATQLPAGLQAPTSLTLGDIDNDGDLDLVATRANYYVPSVGLVWLNNGTGTFTEWSQGPYGGVLLGNNTTNGLLGDVDGDGDLDLISANQGDPSFSGASSVSVRLNDGTGVFAYQTDGFLGNIVHNVALGDLDADGDLDMVVSNQNYTKPGEVIIRLNNGLGNFTTAETQPAGTYPTCLVLGDVDGDNDLDIVAGTYASTKAGMQVLLNQPQVALSTNSLSNSERLQVYPNPVSFLLNIKLPPHLSLQAARITLLNNLGQSVRTLTCPANGVIAVDVQNLVSGIYEVCITTSDQQLSQRIVIE